MYHDSRAGFLGENGRWGKRFDFGGELRTEERMKHEVGISDPYLLLGAARLDFGVS